MNEAKKSSRFGAITPEVLREIEAAVGRLKTLYEQVRQADAVDGCPA